MITAVVWGLGLVVLAGLVLVLRKSGKDAARADAAEEVVRDIQDANKPLTTDELERVRGEYRRD